MKNKPRILMVEEDVALARTLSSVLKTHGYDVATAEDREQAVEYIRKRPVELVFMDSKMFVTRGVERYERISDIRPEVELVMRPADAPENSLDRVTSWLTTKDLNQP